MATSSITKDFVIHDKKTFDKLQKELQSEPKRTQTVQSTSLKKGREKLSTFVFR